MLLRFFRPLIICLTLACSGTISAQDSGTMSELIRSLDSCLKSGEPCNELLDEALVRVNEIADDTLASQWFLEIASTRNKFGQWDSITERVMYDALRRVENTPFHCHAAQAQFSLTRFALFQDNPDTTVQRAQKALSIAEKCGKKRLIAHAWSFVGAAFIEKSNYKEALKNLIISEKLFIEEGDSLGVAMVLQDMSIVQSELQNKEAAMEFSMRAARIFKGEGKEMRYAIAMIDLCSDFLDMGMPDSALKYLPTCEMIVQGKHQLALAYTFQHYGTAYQLKGKHEVAIDHYNKALDQIAPIGDIDLMTRVNTAIAESYLVLKKSNDAHTHALIADSCSRIIGANYSRVEALHILAETSFAIGDHQLGQRLFRAYDALKDSLIGLDKQNEIVALEQEYEAEKRAAEIKLHKQENELLTQQNRASKNRNIALVLAILMIAAAAYALINAQRAKLRTQRVAMQLAESENQNLSQAVAHKNRELTSKALHLAQKNEILRTLQSDLITFQKAESDENDLSELIGKLRFDEQLHDSWDQFTLQFTETNPTFYQNLQKQHSDLTKNELRLASLIRMALDSKAIGNMLNISDEGVKKARYRLRKKLGLEASQNLDAYVRTF